MLALRREAEALFVSAESKGNQKHKQLKANSSSALSSLPPPVSLPALSALSAPLSLTGPLLSEAEENKQTLK